MHPTIKTSLQSLPKVFIEHFIFFTLFVLFFSQLLPITSIKALGDGSIASTVEISSLTPNGPVLLDDDDYASGASSIGDLDQDGVDDIAVGAFNASNVSTNLGAVFIHFMNTDGSVKATVRLDDTTPNGATFGGDDLYGRSVADVGDLDNDGVLDIAVGAAANDIGGTNRGAVFIHFMNTDGSIKSTSRIDDMSPNGPVLNNDDRFGSDIANMGDFDGDGVEDIAVGAIADDAGGSDRGCIHIMFLNTDGSVKSTVEVNDLTTNGPVLANSDTFGRAVAMIGDLNNDGVRDFLVGTPLSDMGAPNRGAAFIIFMNSDATVKSTVSISSLTANGPTLTADEHYGTAVCDLGDLNEDGVLDLAVGAVGGAIGSGSKGEVFIHYMNPDGSVKGTSVIDDQIANGPLIEVDDRFGSALDNIGDLNRDGIPDLIVGATYSDRGGTDRGAIFLMFMGDLSFYSDSPTRLASGALTDHNIVIGTSYGLVSSGQTLQLEFDPLNQGFNLSTITLADVNLTDANGINRTLDTAAGVNTWGLTIDSVNDVLTFTTPTSGTGYYTVSDALYIQIGTNTGGTNQIANPSTSATNKLVITINNAAPGEYGEILLPIIDNDQVDVTAYINTFITFDIDTGITANVDCDFDECLSHEAGAVAGNYTVDLGELNSAWVNSSQSNTVRHSDGIEGLINSIYLDLTTNAWNGAVVIVNSLNGGLKDSGSNIISSVLVNGTTISANSGLYGFRLPLAGTGEGVINPNNCVAADEYCILPSTIFEEVFNTNQKPLDRGRIRMDIGAAASYVNNPGIYTDTLTFVAVAEF